MCHNYLLSVPQKGVYYSLHVTSFIQTSIDRIIIFSFFAIDVHVIAPPF